MTRFTDEGAWAPDDVHVIYSVLDSHATPGVEQAETAGGGDASPDDWVINLSHLARQAPETARLFLRGEEGVWAWAWWATLALTVLCLLWCVLRAYRVLRCKAKVA